MLTLFASDSSALGRLDYASLTQQTLMELLVDGIVFTKYGDPKKGIDVSRWSYVDVDPDGDVTSWFPSECNLTGSVALQWLPKTVVDVDISMNSLCGTLDLECLPDGLQELIVYKNKFSGPVSLTRLPTKMRILNLGFNRLSGTLNLTQLPAAMTELHLCGNDFVGATDFSKLPESLELLDIMETQLEGRVSPKDGLEVYVDGSEVEIV
uniref:Leucine-rich repeat protein n=1 Tax=Paramoeba aestuarina TaxID=180227 RepID=A0A7S4U8T9_9EUKA|mmetsp:Transcript_9195/g.13917  ORF Transcript_9195/g.13917 Transcript_9195/m.13917 type:complete len:209 (+) Transcript_9195:29-655(+)